jgi:cobalt-precorrin 5A hydrolase
MTRPTTAVYAVTERGARLGEGLAARLGARLFVPERLAPRFAATPYGALGELVAETFGGFGAHVFVCACGIAVRVIAPHLRDKTVDPAVVVLDDAGRFAVSLLSGHLGGANALALAVAEAVGATAVVTTATDAAGAPAVEVLARELGLALDNPVAVRRVNAALAAGEPVAVFDPLAAFPVTDPALARFFTWMAAPVPAEPDGPLVVVGWRLGPETPQRLYLRPPVLAVGVGCRRGAPAGDILGLVDRVCLTAGASPKSIGVLASIEAKRHEPGLLEAAAALGAATHFFSADQLAAVPVPHPSATVAKHMGVASVCEAAAILASAEGRLLAPKTSSGLATAALAR